MQVQWLECSSGNPKQAVIASLPQGWRDSSPQIFLWLDTEIVYRYVDKECRLAKYFPQMTAKFTHQLPWLSVLVESRWISLTLNTSMWPASWEVNTAWLTEYCTKPMLTCIRLHSRILKLFINVYVITYTEACFHHLFIDLPTQV